MSHWQSSEDFKSVFTRFLISVFSLHCSYREANLSRMSLVKDKSPSTGNVASEDLGYSVGAPHSTTFTFRAHCQIFNSTPSRDRE